MEFKIWDRVRSQKWQKGYQKWLTSAFLLLSTKAFFYPRHKQEFCKPAGEASLPVAFFFIVFWGEKLAKILGLCPHPRNPGSTTDYTLSK